MTTPANASSAARFLGLDAEASPEQVAEVHQKLSAFLTDAPADLQPWAQRQLGLAQRAVEGAGIPDPHAEELALLGLDPEVDSPAAGVAPVIRPPKKKGWQMPAALAALSAIVVVGVYMMGGEPQPQAAATPSAQTQQAQQGMTGSTPKPVDPEMVKTLEEKIEKDPKDVLSMKALGQVYDGAGDYANAAKWQKRVTEVTPKDPTAWLALGVAQFNAANLKDAEVSWTRAKELDPKQAVTYYNLGFLYMSKNDMAKARENWQKVVDLDPKSQLAKSVQSHLGKSPSASTAPSAKAGSPSASPTR